MTDELLAQIRAAPADDAPRMVYADELLARGDERGEYIHLELARARQFRLTREQRARRLELREHQDRWAAELGCTVPVEWRRGFPYAIADAVRGRELIERLPITTLALTATDLEDVCELPELALIEELRIDRPARHPIESSDLDALCACELVRLRALSFRPEAMRDELADVIAAATWFGQLTTLEVNHLTGVGLERLLDVPPPLSRLAISSSNLGVRGARALAMTALPSLDDLTLYDASLGAGLHLALTNPRVSALRRLWISVESWVELPVFTNLVDLGLGLVDLDLGSLLARTWPTLRSLDLSTNWIDADGAVALAASTAFPALRRLSLLNTLIQERGAKAFATRTGLPALEELWLSSVFRSDEGDERTWWPVEEVKSWFAGTALEVL